MGHANRGKQLISDKGNRARGKCPQCGKTGIKLIWPAEEGTAKVCKNCRKKKRK